MALRFTTEHDELRRTVRSFLAQHSPEPEVRRVMATDDGYDPAVWSRLAGLGLVGLAVPEEFGGAGFGPAESAPLLAEGGGGAPWAPPLSPPPAPPRPPPPPRCPPG